MRKKICLFLAFCMAFLCMFGSQSILQAYDDKVISLLGIIDEDGADRTSWMEMAEESLYDMGHAQILKYIGFNATDFMSALDAHNMLVVQTHGLGCGKGILAVKNGEESYVTTAMIKNSFAKDSLSQMRICYIGACSSGCGGATADNMVNAVYGKGAECVIGYLGTVYTAHNSMMLKNFCYYMSLGYQVDDALSMAQTVVFARYGAYGGVDQRLVRGNQGISITTASYQNLSAVQSEQTYALQTGMNLDNYFIGLEEEGYRLENYQNATARTQCMRKYINNIKTNDIVFYVTDLDGNILTHGSPRVGNGEIVASEYQDLCEQDILSYVQDTYKILEVNDIILDVEDVENVGVDIYYYMNGKEGQCLEEMEVSLNEIIAER